MPILHYVLICVVVVFGGMAILLTVRNNWVLEKRLELNRFENGNHIINAYVGYYEMVFRFWVWDVEKFRKA